MRLSALLSVACAATIVMTVEASAQNATLPMRRAGYWEVTITAHAPRDTVMKSMFCTDATVEQHVSVLGKSMAQNVCSRTAVRRTATGWTFDGSCKAGAMTITTSATVSGDFQTHYHFDAVSHMSPPPAPGYGDSTTSADGKWLGPCPAGRKPGDMVMPNGMVVNIASMGAHK
jgi:Protein of unknown function (DUF3617)